MGELKEEEEERRKGKNKERENKKKEEEEEENKKSVKAPFQSIMQYKLKFSCLVKSLSSRFSGVK